MLKHITALFHRVDRRTLAIFFGCFLLYYWVYGHYYIRGEITHGSDTHGMWTIEYLAFYSIAKFGEFSWWDPTGVNGWPAYANLLNWTFSYFNPYTLPYLIGFKLVSLVHEVSPEGLNKAMVVQKLIWFYLLNLAAVMLIAREVVQTWTARALVAIAFTLGVIQFQGFRDSHQFMVLPGALFYLWGLVRYERHRTLGNFLLFILLSGMYLSSFGYAVMCSAFYWTTGFTVLLLLFRRCLLGAMIGHLREAWRSAGGKAVVIAGVALLALGLAAPLSSTVLNVGHLMRVTGSQPLNWSHGIFGDWQPPHFHTPTYELWTNVMYFASRFELHDLLFKFDPYASGIDHRYVGLVVLPLTLAALVIGFRHRLLGPLLLTVFVCVAFIPYTIDNLAYFTLMHVKLFQNVRVVGGLLPRDGPALFLILMAAIGLDQLLHRNFFRARSPSVADEDLEDDRRLGYLLAAILIVLAAIATFLILSAFVAGYAVPHKPGAAMFRSVLSYTGTYLGLFSLLTLLLLITSSLRGKRILVAMLLLLATTDLILVGSHYFLNRPGYVNFKEADANGYWRKPTPRTIGPIADQSQSWAGSYRGIMHNLAGGPWVGLREWLILEGRSRYATLLENWDRNSKFMTAYPHFRFYTAGRYVPQDRIKEIDSVEAPTAPGQWVYVHDELLAADPASIRAVDATWSVEEFAPNKVRVKVSTSRDSLMVYFDNYDRFWNAAVDDKPVPVHRANFTFKAIRLPAGEHVIEWRFNPWPVKLAWTLFYLALAGYCFLAWRLARRKAQDP